MWDANTRFRPPPSVILLAPVAVSLVLQVPATIAAAAWTHAPRWAGLLGVALAIAAALCLLAARRWPGPTVVAVSALAVASVFVPPGVGPPFIALAFAIVGAIVRGARLWALIAAGGGWLVAVVVGTLIGLQWHPFRVAAATAGIVVCFAVGEGIRTRLERASARRARLAARRLTVEQAERARIARELHDVLAHSLSQISVQSGMALHLFDREPEKAREALVHIRELSGAGLDEVRGVLGFLRGDEPAPVTPQPQLADLPALAQSRSGLGLEVSVRPLDGDAAPPSAVQSTAYRIVQEALTNVVRHSGGTHATIAVERADDALRVTIDDDGTGLPDGRAVGGGIRGMRERAELDGGTLLIGPRPGGGTRVVATLPWERA